MDLIDSFCLREIASNLDQRDLISLMLTNTNFYKQLEDKLCYKYNDILFDYRWVALKNNKLYFAENEDEKIKNVPFFDVVIKKIESGVNFMMALDIANKLWTWGSQNFVLKNIVDFSCDKHWIVLSADGKVNFNGKIFDFSHLKPVTVWTSEENAIVICRKSIHQIHPNLIEAKFKRRVFEAKICRRQNGNSPNFNLTVKHKDGYWTFRIIDKQTLKPVRVPLGIEKIIYQADQTCIDSLNCLSLLDNNIFWVNNNDRIFYPKTLDISGKIVNIKTDGYRRTIIGEIIIDAFIITSSNFYVVNFKGNYGAPGSLEPSILTENFKKFLAQLN